MGQAHERAGAAAAAMQAYEKFLALWKDADPELTELQEGKARLAALQARERK
jgi:hypothetical protein